jgi:hypothetical protein
VEYKKKGENTMKIRKRFSVMATIMAMVTVMVMATTAKYGA